MRLYLHPSPGVVTKAPGEGDAEAGAAGRLAGVEGGQETLGPPGPRSTGKPPAPSLPSSASASSWSPYKGGSLTGEQGPPEGGEGPAVSVGGTRRACVEGEEGMVRSRERRARCGGRAVVGGGQRRKRECKRGGEGKGGRKTAWGWGGGTGRDREAGRAGTPAARVRTARRASV